MQLKAFEDQSSLLRFRQQTFYNSTFTFAPLELNYLFDCALYLNRKGSFSNMCAYYTYLPSYKLFLNVDIVIN